MVQAKFGLPQTAIRQLEIYTTAVLLATLRPPPPPREEKWRNLMEEISKISCQSYRSTVYENQEFLTYFHEATPQAELGFLNIGSRPTRRKSSGGIGNLRCNSMDIRVDPNQICPSCLARSWSRTKGCLRKGTYRRNQSNVQRMAVFPVYHRPYRDGFRESGY